MDALPGTPQIQNIIPTTFFDTDDLAAPIARADRRASSSSSPAWPISTGGGARPPRAGEGYGTGHLNEPEPVDDEQLASSADRASLPLVVVGVLNKVFTDC